MESIQPNQEERKERGGPIVLKRILVVEDNDLVAKSLQVLLARIGYEVEIGEDGERGLMLYDRDRHDIIITDFALGKMTGLELARAIKLKNPAQPIILMTAYGEALNIRKERLSDFVALLGKPFSQQELTDALQKALAL